MNAPPSDDRRLARLVERVARWAAGRADVRAVALVGSHARGEARAGSDVDLVVLTEDPARYVEHDAWARELGLGPLVRTRRWGVVTERRFASASGAEVDVAIATPAWASPDPLDDGTRRVVADGMRALYDPDGLLAELLPS